MTKANASATDKEKEALFDRGFKAWCENTSETIRGKLGLSPISPLSPFDLASKLGIDVWPLASVPGLAGDCIEYLSSTDGDEWSAVTVVVEGRQIIIINPSHSAARQSSDLMHELAHVIKRHEAGQVIISESYALRNFDEKQEAEADWFAGVLLLPRAALAQCTYLRVPTEKILSDYVVSRALFDYRMRMAGVNKQFQKRGRVSILPPTIKR